MTGSLQHLGGDRYRVRVYAGLDPITRRKRLLSKSFHASTEQAAKRSASKHISDLRDSLDERDAVRGTVAEFVDSWEKLRIKEGASPTTTERNRSILRRIRAELGHHQLRNLTAQHVDEFYATLRTTPLRSTSKTPKPPRYMSESTVHHYHRVLSAILHRAEAYDLIDRVATKRARRPKKIERKVVAPADSVLEPLLAAAPPWLQLPVVVDGFLGLRRGELFGLRWSDLSHGIAHVQNNRLELPGGRKYDRIPKGKRARLVPIPEPIQQLLAAHRVALESAATQRRSSLAEDARVFPDLLTDATGRTPMSPAWLSQAWRRHCERHGQHVTIHQLRHWCATRMIDDGTPLPVVQAILGHASIQTTMGYTHLAEGALERAGELMGRALPGVLALPRAT